MHKQPSSFLIACITIMSILFTLTPISAAPSATKQTQSQRPRISAPQAPVQQLSQPKAACSPVITTINGSKVYQFTTVGNCDWAIPSNVNSIELLVVGGGGGGGFSSGGGGGGGQVVSRDAVTVTPGTNVALLIGSGGDYGYNYNNASIGSNSSVTIAANATTAQGGNYGGSNVANGGNAIAAVGIGTKLTNNGGGTGGTGSASFFSSGGSGTLGFLSSINGAPTIYGNGGNGGGLFNNGAISRFFGAGGAGGAFGSAGNNGMQGVVYIREAGYLAAATATASNTNTATTTRTNTRTNTNTATRTNTRTNTNTATATLTKTNTATRTNTSTNTVTKTNTSTSTLTPVIAVPTQVPFTRSNNGQITTWGDNPPYNLNLIPQDGNSNIAQIALGAHHALAVTTNGNVVGWGTNLYGELTIPNMSDIVQVAVGLNHSVALKSNGSVQMWGKQTSLTAPADGRTTGITQIAAGDNHTVLLGNDGRVFVYGSSSQPSFTGKNIVAIAAGSDSSLALGDDGAVYRWGVSSAIPVRVAGSVMRIFATGNLYGALRSDGELILWGSAVTNLNLTGNATSISSGTGCPCIKIPSMVGLRSVNLTKWGVILTRRSQQFLAFAYQGYTIPEGIPSNSMQLSTHPSHGVGIALVPVAPQVIIPTNTPATSLTLHLPQEFNTPGYLRLWGNDPLVSAIPVTATSQLLNVATGDNHIAVLGTDGVVTSWGDNRYGQSTVPATLQIARPLTDTLRVVSLAAGADHTMALRANGSVMAWGNNDAGQVTVPTGLSNVVQIAAGVQHSVALLADGTVRSWGSNSVGQTTQPALGGIAKIAAGGWHTIALRRDNTVIAWGLNDVGQTTLGNYTNVIDIAASAKNSMLLLANGQIIVVGQNEYVQRSVPTGYYQRIGAGAHHLLAISDNEQAVGWGLNADNQTAIPGNLYHPFQITGGMNFSAALVQQLVAPVDNDQTIAPTAPALPYMPTALPQPSHTQFIEITANGVSAPTNFNGSKIAVTTGYTATIGFVKNVYGNDVNGVVTVNRRADAPLCDFSIDVRKTAFHYDIALAEYGMALGLDRSVSAWATGLYQCPEDITNDIPTAFQQRGAEISIRGTHMMVRTIDGRVWSNRFALPQIIGIKHIAAGRDFAALLLNDGTIKVWADNNEDGILTIPTTATNITEIAAGDYHLLALRANGQVVSWGANAHDYGQADIPYAATMGNVVAINAGERQSIVQLRTGKAVAWGDYPANIPEALESVNRDHFITGVVTGDRRIFVLIDDPDVGASTATIIPTATPVALLTMTPQGKPDSVMANQIAWYTMSNFNTPQVFADIKPNASFRCSTPRTCPNVITSSNLTNNGLDNTPALKFNDSASHELVAAQNTALNGVPFTIRATLRRASLNRADVMVSIGTPGNIRKYFVMGIDKENRPYCSFYGDDLRSTTWYSDLQWHSYACSYDPTSRVRTLWRDNQIIGQDVVKGDFTPPAAPLIIGRRYDNMNGLNGDIERVSVIDHVITQPEQDDITTVSTANIRTELQVETQLQSISPNGGIAICSPRNGSCPRFGAQDIQPNVSGAESENYTDVAMFGMYCIGYPVNSCYDGRDNRIQINTPLPSSFTLAYWIQPVVSGRVVILDRRFSTTDGSGATTLTGVLMGFDTDGEGANRTAFCELNGTRLVSTSLYGGWHHVACSYDQGTTTATLYVDNQLMDQNTAVTLPVGVAPIKIGLNPHNPLDGNDTDNFTIDDIMIYGSAVPAYVITQIYNLTNRMPNAIVEPMPTATECASPSNCATATVTPTFSASPTPSSTAAFANTKTPLKATATVTMPLVKTFTNSPTATKTITVTKTTTATTTRTITMTTTITRTATAYPIPPTNTSVATAYPPPTTPTNTKTTTATNTSTRTRTLTRTRTPTP